MPTLKNISVIKELWIYIDARRRKQLILVFFLMVVASFAEVASIGAVLPFLGALIEPERVFSSQNLQPIILFLKISSTAQLTIVLTVLFIFAAIFSGAVRFFLLFSQTRLSFDIGADLSNQVYKKTLFQPYAVHINRNSSEVISAILHKTGSLIHGALLPLLAFASSCLMLAAILFALFAIDPVVAIATLGGFSVIYGTIVFGTRGRLTRESKQVSVYSNMVVKALHEGLGGIRDVLLDGAQETYCKQYQNADLPLRRAQANLQIIGVAPRYLIEPCGMAIIAVLAYVLTLSENGVATAIPVLGALAIGAQRLLPVVQQLYSSWTSVRGSQESIRDVLDMLAQPLPECADQSFPVRLPFQRSIRLDSVWFRYSATLPWVLSNINLEIPRGSRVGIIGLTGSGKSTLLDIIMGLLSPSEGCLEIDGAQITQQNNRAWQAHIAHVPQAIYLSDATIAENIAFGLPSEKIDRAKLVESARQAQIAETIESWGTQYGTIVGERGVRLSGGQRQRIAIARALYKSADVIIFDEATSALDHETERSVMESFNLVGREVTAIIVAHRLTTLKNCDMVIEIENGKVKRSGAYPEIINK